MKKVLICHVLQTHKYSCTHFLVPRIPNFIKEPHLQRIYPMAYIVKNLENVKSIFSEPDWQNRTILNSFGPGNKTCSFQLRIGPIYKLKFIERPL